MERYSEYKDSGVQWLGEIPSHWKTLRLNKLCKFKTGTTPSFYDKELDGELVDWYTPSDIKDAFVLNSSIRKLNLRDFLDSNYNYIPPYSILLIGIGATAGKCGCNTIPCYTNQQITSLIPNNSINSLFLTMYLSSIRNILLESAHFTTLPILNNRFLSSIPTVLPPLAEQEKIVSFIKDKTQKIDTFIAEKEKELQLLEELKQSEIANAVTKGLNPNVTMKDSGISWIGEIPEHWNIVKLKVYCKENKVKNKENQESNVLSLSYGNVIVKQDLNSGLLPDNYSGYQIVNPGNIILRLTDLQNDHRSLRTGLVKYRGIITSAYVGLIVEKINPQYTQFLLHTYDILKVFYSMGGGLRQSMSYKDVANLFVCVPPIEEQQAIVEYIGEKAKNINTLISELKTEIEYIKENKQRLISDAVTGQIKVC